MSAEKESGNSAPAATASASSNHDPNNNSHAQERPEREHHLQISSDLITSKRAENCVCNEFLSTKIPAQDSVNVSDENSGEGEIREAKGIAPSPPTPPLSRHLSTQSNQPISRSNTDPIVSSPRQKSTITSNQSTNITNNQENTCQSKISKNKNFSSNSTTTTTSTATATLSSTITSPSSSSINHNNSNSCGKSPKSSKSDHGSSSSCFEGLQLRKWYKKLTEDERRRVVSIMDEELGELVLLMSLKLKKEGPGFFSEVGTELASFFDIPSVSSAESGRNRSNSLSGVSTLGSSNLNSRPSRSIFPGSRNTRTATSAGHSSSTRSKSQTREPILRVRSSSINSSLRSSMDSLACHSTSSKRPFCSSSSSSSSSLSNPKHNSSNTNTNQNKQSISLPGSLSSSSSSWGTSSTNNNNNNNSINNNNINNNDNSSKSFTDSILQLGQQYGEGGKKNSSNSSTKNMSNRPTNQKMFTSKQSTKHPFPVRYFDDFFASDLIALNPYTPAEENFLFWKQSALVESASFWNEMTEIDQELVDAIRLCDAKQYLDTITLSSEILKNPLHFFNVMRIASRGWFLSKPCKMTWQSQTKSWKVEKPEWLEGMGIYSFSTYLASQFEMVLWQGFYHHSNIHQKKDASKKSSVIPRHQELLSKHHLVDFWKNLNYNQKTAIIMSMGNMIEAKMRIDISALNYPQLLSFLLKLTSVSRNVSNVDNPLLKPNNERDFIDFIFLSPLRRAGTGMDLVLRRLGVFIETAYANKQCTDLILGEKMEKEQAKGKAKKKKGAKHTTINIQHSNTNQTSESSHNNSSIVQDSSTVINISEKSVEKTKNQTLEQSPRGVDSAKLTRQSSGSATSNQPNSSNQTTSKSSSVSSTSNQSNVVQNTTKIPSSMSPSNVPSNVPSGISSSNTNALPNFTVIAGRRKGPFIRAKDDSAAPSQKCSPSTQVQSQRRSKDDTHTDSTSSDSKSTWANPKRKPSSVDSSSVLSNSTQPKNQPKDADTSSQVSPSTHVQTPNKSARNQPAVTSLSSVTPTAVTSAVTSAVSNKDEMLPASPSSQTSFSTTTASTGTTHSSFTHPAPKLSNISRDSLKTSSESLPLPTTASTEKVAIKVEPLRSRPTSSPPAPQLRHASATTPKQIHQVTAVNDAHYSQNSTDHVFEASNSGRKSKSQKHISSSSSNSNPSYSSYSSIFSAALNAPDSRGLSTTSAPARVSAGHDSPPMQSHRHSEKPHPTIKTKTSPSVLKSDPKPIPSSRKFSNQQNQRERSGARERQNNNMNNRDNSSHHDRTSTKAMSIAAQPYYPPGTYAATFSPPRSAQLAMAQQHRMSTPPARLQVDQNWVIGFGPWPSRDSEGAFLSPIEFGPGSSKSSDTPHQFHGLPPGIVIPSQAATSTPSEQQHTSNTQPRSARGKRNSNDPHQFNQDISNPLAYLGIPTQVNVAPARVPVLSFANPGNLASGTHFLLPIVPQVHFRAEFTPHAQAGCNKLSKDITEFVNRVDVANESKRTHAIQIASKIQTLVDSLWPGKALKAEVYGSFATNLGIPSSDLDVVIKGLYTGPIQIATPHVVGTATGTQPRSLSLPNSPRDAAHTMPLAKLHEALLKENWVKSEQVQFIDTASVPVIKLVTSSNLPVDITMEDQLRPHTGVTTRTLIQHFVDQFSDLRPLALVLKQMLADNDLNNTYFGGMSSYFLTLMLISFLQIYGSSSSPKGTGALLLNFLELFGIKFNYGKTQISILDTGSHIMIPDVIAPNGAPEIASNPPPTLIIVDPLNPTTTFGQSVFSIWQIQMAFKNAYQTLLAHYFEGDPSKKSKQVNELLKSLLSSTPH